MSRLLLRHARLIRLAVALAGAGLVARIAVAAWQGPAPGWLRGVFVAWCVGVPYWHFLEYRFLLDPRACDAERARFLELQGLSRTLWLGVALVLGVALLRG